MLTEPSTWIARESFLEGVAFDFYGVKIKQKEWERLNRPNDQYHWLLKCSSLAWNYRLNTSYNS
jgi:hypothetical protein